MGKKQYNIRWKESDLQELQRTINNFNAKLYRTKKKHPDTADYLPDRVNKTQLMKNITTRQDYNRTIKSLQRFSKKGSEKPVKSSRGAKTTQWEIDEYKRKEKRVNRQKKKEAERVDELSVTSRGKEVGYKKKEMGSATDNDLKPRDFKFENKSDKEWEITKRAIDKALDDNWKKYKKELMLSNYLKGLEENGFNDVADIVRQIDIDRFVDTALHDTEATFDFIHYDPTEHGMKNKALLEVWESALEKQLSGD